MSNYEKLQELSAELEEYVNLEGTEVGEYWGGLCNLSRSTDAMSREFEAALIKEMEEVLSDIKTNYKIVKTSRQITITDTELEYIG
jgi:hypothetical protein